MKFLIPPWQHQLDAVERAKDLPGFAFLFEVGTGKTAAAIHSLRWRFMQECRVMKTLILGPPIVLENWRREIKMHSTIKPEFVTVLKGSGKDRESTFYKEVEGTPKGHVFITNYESLLMEDLFEALKLWRPEVIVFDESHRLKNVKAKRTKRAVLLADGAKFKYLLTGTPILNSPMDLYSQWRILDGGKTFGKSFFQFRNHYFWDKNAGMPKTKYFPNWVPKERSFEEMSEKIKGLSMRVKKADCLDLPPLVKKEVFVELGAEQKRMYREMKKDFITFLSKDHPDKAVVATLAITKALRLMQICSGFTTYEEVKDDATTERKNAAIDDNPRRDALKELLESLAGEHKVIVWAVFKENYAAVRQVCEELGLPAVEVHGEVSAKDKDRAVQAFNTDPAVRVFIGHPRSGGIGINLIPASYSIFYSRSFSLEDDIQAEARNYRGGSEIHQKVTRIDLIAKDTIDEEISLRLAAKEAISESVLKDIAKNL